MASADEKARTTGGRALSQSEVQSCRCADASRLRPQVFSAARDADNGEETLSTTVHSE